MIYVVLIPAWIWFALILVAWATFAYQTNKRIGFGHHVIVGLFATLTFKSIAALSTAIATSQNSIGAFACLMGIFGILLSPIVLLVEAAVLVFWSRVWLRSNGDRKLGFGAWLSIWFILSLIAFLTHLQSAALCTV